MVFRFHPDKNTYSFDENVLIILLKNPVNRGTKSPEISYFIHFERSRWYLDYPYQGIARDNKIPIILGSINSKYDMAWAQWFSKAISRISP
jgi:hypothetical protein